MKALTVGEAESVLGEISVSVKREIGFEKLKLYVTSKRIIVAHGSKKGRGALALRPLLGRYSGIWKSPRRVVIGRLSKVILRG